jgi:hypothetical protein
VRKNYEISEYGVIRSKEDYDIESSFKSLKELYLPKELFNDLFEFIMQNQEEKKEGERMFSIFSKGKKRQIKTKNYVFCNMFLAHQQNLFWLFVNYCGYFILFDPFHASLFKLRRTQSGSYCFFIANPALHTGLIKFDYFHASPSAMQDTVVVLEQRPCPA